MVLRLSYLSMIFAIQFGLVWLSDLPLRADTAGAAIKVTPPLATAKTIQVTEIVWEAQGTPAPGPIRKAGTMTFRLEKPDKFWVQWKETDPSKPAQYTISDGQTMVSYEGKNLQSFRSHPTASWEWPYSMTGLLNNMPGTVSTTPAVRDGKKILLAVESDRPIHNEFWFDPKSHLLIRWSMFMIWHGKTSETMRTEYTGWILNKPISPSVFRVPSPGSVPQQE